MSVSVKALSIEDVLVGEVRAAVSEGLSLALETVKLIFKGKKLTQDHDHLHLALFTTATVGKRPSLPQIMVTGTEHEALQSVQSLRADPTVAPFKRVVAASQLARPYNATTPQSQYGFERIEVLEALPNSEHARRILQRLASDPGIRHVMETHRWKVGLLAEMYPEGKVAVDPVCVLGYNTNKGQSITLRLRTDDMRGFRYFETIKEVLFHELSHNVHSDHDAQFKALMSQLRKEAAHGDWTRSEGHSLTHRGPHKADDADNREDDSLYQEFEIDQETRRFNEVNRLGGGGGGSGGAPISSRGGAGSPEPSRDLLASAALNRAQNSSPPPPSPSNTHRPAMAPIPAPTSSSEPPRTRESRSSSSSPPPPRQTTPTIPATSSPVPQEEIQVSVRYQEQLALLTSMGFQQQASEEAITKTVGDVEGALQLLLAASDTSVLAMSPPSPPNPSSFENVPTPVLEDMDVDGNQPQPQPALEIVEVPQEIDERVLRVRRALEQLRISTEVQQAKETLEVLLAYLSNVLKDPTNDKFRKIRASNAQFLSKVTARPGATEVLQSCGFFLEGDFWVLKRNDPGLLWLGKSMVEEKLGEFGSVLYAQVQ